MEIDNKILENITKEESASNEKKKKPKKKKKEKGKKVYPDPVCDYIGKERIS